MVSRAWNWNEILGAHAWYLDAGASALQKLEKGGPGGVDPATMAREELLAYRTAFESDPLLPSALWPSGYTGPKVAALHRRLVRALRRHM